MKASKVIVIAAAVMAVGASIPVIRMMTEQEIKPMPVSPKFTAMQKAAAAVTTALPAETTAAATGFTTSLTAQATTAAVTAKYDYADSGLAAAAVTIPAVTTVPTAVITETTAAAAQTTAAPQTAPAAEKKPAVKPVPAPVPAQEEQREQEEAVSVKGDKVTYKGKTFSTDQTEIDLSGKKMKEADLAELKDLAAQFPNLQKIVLCDCGLSNETLAAFQDEIGIRVVWRVKLGTQWSLRTDAVAFSVLIMNYKHIRMTSEDLEVLKYCPDLRALDLGHQALTDLSKIAEYLPELRLLIIADNQVSDLSPLANLKHLHYLEIFVNRVTDLSPLADLKELVDVNISYNPISDISPLLNSPMMQRVWLESTRVSADGVDQLRETYPEAKIVNIGEGSVDQGWRWGNARYEQMMKMWYGNFYGDEFQKFDDLAVSLGLRG